MSGWDLKFAIRIDQLNARLAKSGPLAQGQKLDASDASGNLVDASASLIEIIEVVPGQRRAPGPKGSLAIQLSLATLRLSGPAVAQIVARSPSAKPDPAGVLVFAKAEIIFQIALNFVTMKDGANGLVFGELPPNSTGQPVVTAKVDRDGSIDALSSVLIGHILENWLRQNFASLSPVFALFGKDGNALGPRMYAYIQSPNAGEDILCVYAAIQAASAQLPPIEAVLPDFVETGKAAFLLSVPALMTTALQPALNAFAADQYKVSGNVFVYNPATQALALAPGVTFQAGMVHTAAADSPLIINQFSLTYADYGGTDGLQLAVAQSALLKTEHSYTNWHSGVTRTFIVDWCTIHREQSDVFDVKVGAGPQGAQPILLVPRDSFHKDNASSQPADTGTGLPVLDAVIRFVQGAIDSTLLFLGPPGLVMFLVKLALTTLGDELNSLNIQNAKNDSKPISPASVIAALKFEWGGIGDINYSSARLAGGLKIIGS